MPPWDCAPPTSLLLLAHDVALGATKLDVYGRVFADHFTAFLDRVAHQNAVRVHTCADLGECHRRPCNRDTRNKSNGKRSCILHSCSPSRFSASITTSVSQTKLDSYKVQRLALRLGKSHRRPRSLNVIGPFSPAPKAAYLVF